MDSRGDQRFAYLGLMMACLVLASSCDRREVVVADAVSGVKIEENKQSLLSSEVVQSGDLRSIIDCPVLLTNTTAKEKQITLLGTGCSCYGVEHDGKLLEKNASFLLQPQETIALQFRSAAPSAPATKDYSADFSVNTSQGEQSFRVTCVLSIYGDVRISPKVITAEGEWGTTSTKQQTVMIQRVMRCPSKAKATSPEPVLKELPTGVTLINVTPQQDIEELGDELFRLTWNAELEIEVPADAAPDAAPLPFKVDFEDSELAKTDGQIVIRSRSPIAFPAVVHFGKLKVGETRQRRIMVSSPEQVSFTLTPTKESNTSLDLKVSDEALPRHWVEISLTPQAAGELSEDVVFKTGLREMPQITIQFKAIVE